MKTTPEIDLQVYQLAKVYLPSLNMPGATEKLIEKYPNPLYGSSLNWVGKVRQELLLLRR